MGCVGDCGTADGADRAFTVPGLEGEQESSGDDSCDCDCASTTVIQGVAANAESKAQEGSEYFEIGGALSAVFPGWDDRGEVLPIPVQDVLTGGDGSVPETQGDTAWQGTSAFEEEMPIHEVVTASPPIVTAAFATPGYGDLYGDYSVAVCDRRCSVQVFVGPVTEREQKIPFKKEPVKFGWCHSWLVINPCTGPKRTYEMPNIDYENQPAFRSLYMESLQMTPEQLASTRKIIPMGFQLWKNLPHEPPLAKGTRLVCTVEDECCKPEGPITPSGESPYPMDCCSLLNDGTMKHFFGKDSWTLSAVLGPGNPPTQANCNVFTATAMALCGVTWTHESDLTGAEGAKEIANTEAGTPFGSGGKCIIPSCMAGADIASLFTFFGKRIGR